ncbi:MAG: hypothetical protein KatS3mg111_1486 [Pirellulaceae bacterium]|nr:MAG: hypothetical protein KatS3mg111_1486 [Pirellulaceae bacterium]
MHSRHKLLAIALAIIVTTFGTMNFRVAASEVRLNLLCGPRCVASVLEHYGMERPDIMHMATELSDFDGDRGTTLASLAQYLESRGLGTKIIQLPPGADVRWEFPVIAHLQKPGTTTGHFIVLMPEPEPQGMQSFLIFDGIAETVRLDRSLWHQWRSGVVLLTSPREIVDDDIQLIRPSFSATVLSSRRLFIVIALCGLLTFVFSLLYFRKRM